MADLSITTVKSTNEHRLRVVQGNTLSELELTCRISGEEARVALKLINLEPLKIEKVQLEG